MARQRCGETLNEQAGKEDGRDLEAEKKEETPKVEGPGPKSIFKAALVPVKI